LLCCQASTDRLAGLWSLHRAIVSCYNLEVREGIFCYGKALLYHSYATVGMPTCHNNAYLLALYGKTPRRAQMLQEGFIMGQMYRLMVGCSE